LNYPTHPTEEDKKRYYSFLESLKYVLPCIGCANNWADKMKDYPPKLNNRKEFFEWSVDMHNQVNKSNGKKELSYNDALNRLSKKKEYELIKDSILLTGSAFLIITFFSLIIARRF
jgi:hypothetical protein